ncbi:MAG: 16S rRNA (uracil(1498)-N(3))-methyltransferase [Rhodobacteraceae bacterium]|nr:16S rRNA (uracil(1498)-N(3))-methyltransferase [Paracoccaceae bacterium]
MSSRVRLFLEHPFAAGQPLPLTAAQAHYLFAVMRLGAGDAVGVFNGRDGEWRAEVASPSRRGGSLVLRAPLAPQRAPADVWLLFAPLRKARSDFLVEKATELGVARLLPVATDFTRAERLSRERLRTHAVEAAEQCGATHVPEIAGLVPLGRRLDDWPAGRALLWADETTAGEGAEGPGAGGEGAAGPPAAAPPAAILVGPEGGFSLPERARLARHPAVRRVTLGPRVLRAETAALAALVLWQAASGAWR